MIGIWRAAAVATAAVSLLLIPSSAVAQGCPSGTTLCGTEGCVPIGAMCCDHTGYDGYCDAGQVCTDRGTCVDGDDGDDEGTCPDGTQPCDGQCMPNGSVCCVGEDAFCPAGTQCSTSGCTQPDGRGGSSGGGGLCSCNTVVPQDDGAVHVCTEGAGDLCVAPAPGSTMYCEPSNGDWRPSSGCSRSGVTACCGYPDRGYVTYSYSDCTAAGCSNFESACQKIGGSPGVCEVGAVGGGSSGQSGSGSGSGSLDSSAPSPGKCSAEPNSSGSHAWIGALLCLVLLALRRTRFGGYPVRRAAATVNPSTSRSKL